MVRYFLALYLLLACINSYGQVPKFTSEREWLQTERIIVLKDGQVAFAIMKDHSQISSMDLQTLKQTTFLTHSLGYDSKFQIAKISETTFAVNEFGKSGFNSKTLVFDVNGKLLSETKPAIQLLWMGYEQRITTKDGRWLGWEKIWNTKLNRWEDYAPKRLVPEVELSDGTFLATWLDPYQKGLKLVKLDRNMIPVTVGKFASLDVYRYRPHSYISFAIPMPDGSLLLQAVENGRPWYYGIQLDFSGNATLKFFDIDFGRRTIFPEIGTILSSIPYGPGKRIGLDHANLCLLDSALKVGKCSSIVNEDFYYSSPKQITYSEDKKLIVACNEKFFTIVKASNLAVEAFLFDEQAASSNCALDRAYLTNRPRIIPLTGGGYRLVTDTDIFTFKK